MKFDPVSDLGTFIQNTRSMDMQPQPAEEFHYAEEPGGSSMEVLLVLSSEVFQRYVNYAIVVETWEHKKGGRHKRAWEAAFTQAERNRISSYYGRFYRWHLVSGTPRRVALRARTLFLLQRAVEFFAGI